MKSIGLLVLGFALGIVAMTFVPEENQPATGNGSNVVGIAGDAERQDLPADQQLSSSPEQSESRQETDQLAAETSYPETASHGTNASPSSNIANRRTPNGSPETVSPARTNTTSLPEEYAHLLQQPQGPRRMTPQEISRFFDADSRDEQWAYTMETGMSEYFARNLTGDGVAIEHLECRGRMCLLAGVVYPGHEDTTGRHFDAMKQTGWWQLSQSLHTVGSAVADGEYRFLTYIPRSDEETLVPAGSACNCE